MAQNLNEWITQLYEKEHTRLCRVAYRLVGNIDTAEELTQDAFMWAWLHREKVLSHPKPGAWLMVTLSNLVKNENRRISAVNLSLEEWFNIPGREDERGLVDLLPPKLPEDDREVLVWRFERRMEYREMANRLGISETACRSRVCRALERCRKLLEVSGVYT